MRNTITSTLDTIRNRDRICVSPIEGRYVLSDEARLKMDGLVESGEDIASELAGLRPSMWCTKGLALRLEIG